jgi:hypothetical protein
MGEVRRYNGVKDEETGKENAYVGRYLVGCHGCSFFSSGFTLYRTVSQSDFGLAQKYGTGGGQGEYRCCRDSENAFRKDATRDRQALVRVRKALKEGHRKLCSYVPRTCEMKFSICEGNPFSLLQITEM